MITNYLTRPRARVFGKDVIWSSPLVRAQHRIRASPSSSLPRTLRNPSFYRRFASIQADKPRAGLDSEFLRIEKSLSELLEKVEILSRSTGIPTERFSQVALGGCERLAQTLAGANIVESADSPTSSLLDLDGLRRHSNPPALSLTAPTRDRITETVSKAAYDVVADPRVFITPSLLATYVETQALLKRPETIPPIFVLYASKQVPRPNTIPIEYTNPNPIKASSAIAVSTASNALDAAIAAKDLPVCFDVINTTVCAPAFRRSKLVRRALFPAFGVAIAPAAAYSAASQWAVWQDTMDSQMARSIMFAGLLAYISFTATIGVVAVTTSNDQMDRVTWTGGTPLRERWLREEERAMLDRVAGAWGFHESWRRGEEEGPDWQSLREWAGLRGMVLDKVELMEGME